MAEYLKRALAQRQPLDPEARQGLIRALAASRSTGNAMDTLSGGEVGGNLQRGADPMAFAMGEIQGDRKLARENYMMERQEGRDLAEDKYRQQKLGVDMATLGHRLGTAATKRTDKEVADISKAMKDIVPMENAFNRMISLVGEYGGDNIPGVGMFEGGPGTLGTLARFFQGPEAQENNAQAQALFNKVARGEIGSQQTIQEAQRIRQQSGTTGWESEEVFRAMLPVLGRAIQEQKANALARGGDVAQEEYARRVEANRPAPAVSGDLSPEEAAELAELEREFGGG